MKSVKRTLLIGAGGQSRVVASILKYDRRIEVVGILDASVDSIGEKISNTSIVGTYEDLDKYVGEGVNSVALCVGNNRERAIWFKKAKSMGLDVVSAIHPTAILESDALIGEGVTVCAGAIVCTQTKIGNGVIINTGSVVDHESVLMDFSSVAPGSYLAGRVCVGEETFIGIGVSISHNIKIGGGTVIGAGAVVVSDIGSDVTAFGVPATVKKV